MSLNSYTFCIFLNENIKTLIFKIKYMIIIIIINVNWIEWIVFMSFNYYFYQLKYLKKRIFLLDTLLLLQ